MRAAETNLACATVEERLQREIQRVRATVWALPASKVEQLSLVNLWDLWQWQHTRLRRALRGGHCLGDGLDGGAVFFSFHSSPGV